MRLLAKVKRPLSLPCAVNLLQSFATPLELGEEEAECLRELRQACAEHPRQIRDLIAAKIKAMHILNPEQPRNLGWAFLISRLLILSKELDDPNYVYSVLEAVTASAAEVSAFALVQSDLIGQMARRTMRINDQLFRCSIDLCRECRDVRSMYGVKCLAEFEPWEQIKDAIYVASLNPHPLARNEAISMIQHRANRSDYSEFLLRNRIISKPDSDRDIFALTNLVCSLLEQK